jgi:hypothetical protein
MVIHPSYYDACDVSCDVISVTVQNRTHVHTNFFLRITHAIISQSIADSSCITLYIPINRLIDRLTD